MLLSPVRLGQGRAGLGLALLMLFGVVIPATSQVTNYFTQAFTPAVGKLLLSPASYSGLYRENEPIQISVSDGGTVRVINLDGATVYQGAPTSLTLTPGHYFVETAGDRTQFAVLPADYAGGHLLGTETWGGRQTDWPVGERMDRMKATWARVMGEGYWSTVEPQPGVWNWSALDVCVATNQAAGRKLFVMAYVRPAWQTNDAQFVSGFANYVKQMAQRYNGKIYGIQIWNEPWYGPDVPWEWRFAGTNLTQFVTSYVTLLQAAHNAIRSVSSTIKIIGPDWDSNEQNWPTPALEEFVRQGGHQWLDVYTWHDDNYDVAPDAPSRYQRVDQRLQYVKNQVGNLPLLITETKTVGASAIGAPAAVDGQWISGINWQRGLARSAKTVVMYAAGGLLGYMPHVLALHSTAGASANWEIYGWEQASASGTARPRGPHPKTSAYLMTCYWLNNATFSTMRAPGEAVFLYAWRRNNNHSLLFAWAPEGQTVTLGNLTGLTTTDIFGRPRSAATLTEQPTLFHSSTLSPTELLNTVLAAVPASLNLAPVFEPVANQSIPVGQTLQFTVAATDPDYDPVTFSISPLPSGATFNSATGVFTWTPTTQQAGSYPLTITATDARGKTTTTPVTIHALGDPLQNLAAHWTFDQSSGLTASNSVGTNHGALNNFNFNTTSGWTTGRVGNALLFDGVNDSVSLNSAALVLTNNFTWMTWVKPLASSSTGMIASVCYDYGNTGFRIQALANSFLVEGRSTTGWQYLTVFTNAVQNGAWHHLAIVYDKSVLNFYVNGALQASRPWGGSLIMNTTFPSRLGMAGSTYFKGALDDLMIFQRTLSAGEIASFASGSSTSTNRAPTLTSPGNKSVNENVNLTFTVSGSDPDGEALTYSASGLPPGATFNTTTRTFSWTPSFAQAGSYNVTFTVSDGSLSATVTITITVTNTNRAPTLTSPGNKSVNENANLTFTVSGSDPDGEALTYSASGLPPGATFNTSTRTFSWTPSYSQAGSYNVTFTVSDGSLSASATITITVANVNRAPTITSPGDKTIVAGNPIAFTVTGSDPDNDPLTYTTGTLPAGASFNASTRQFAWTPTALQFGAHNVTFNISDGSLTANATITITVTSPTGTTTNTAPLLTDPDALNTTANVEVTATIQAADADGDSVSFSASGLPTGATLSTNGVFRWTPTLAQTGVFVPSIVLSDGRVSTAVKLPVFVTHPNYDWLAGAKLFAHRQINDRIFVYSFRRLDRTSIVFAWTASGYSYPLRPVEGLQQVTLTGGTSNFTTLGTTPVLFLSDERISPRQALDRVVAAIQY